MPADDDLVAIADHEACHCAAAYLLGRKIAGVTIRRTEDARGMAHIYTLREPQSLEEALSDITIFLVGDIFSGWQSHALEWAETGVAKLDEARAFNSASKVAATALEIAAVVELGRARARAMLGREDF
jgi:hypothetical protein